LAADHDAGQAVRRSGLCRVGAVEDLVARRGEFLEQCGQAALRVGMEIELGLLDREDGVAPEGLA